MIYQYIPIQSKLVNLFVFCNENCNIKSTITIKILGWKIYFNFSFQIHIHLSIYLSICLTIFPSISQSIYHQSVYPYEPHYIFRKNFTLLHRLTGHDYGGQAVQILDHILFSGAKVKFHICTLMTKLQTKFYEQFNNCLIILR